jgi:hypothetical protein
MNATQDGGAQFYIRAPSRIFKGAFLSEPSQKKEKKSSTKHKQNKSQQHHTIDD